MNYIFLIIMSSIAGHVMSWLWDKMIKYESFQKLKKNRFKVSWYKLNKTRFHSENSTL